MLTAPEFGFDVAYIEAFNSRSKGLTLARPGISEPRLAEIEAAWRFRFPPDLRWLLGASRGALYRWDDA